jgi:hypothetical protein
VSASLAVMPHATTDTGSSGSGSPEDDASPLSTVARPTRCSPPPAHVAAPTTGLDCARAAPRLRPGRRLGGSRRVRAGGYHVGGGDSTRAAPTWASSATRSRASGPSCPQPRPSSASASGTTGHDGGVLAQEGPQATTTDEVVRFFDEASPTPTG